MKKTILLLVLFCISSALLNAGMVGYFVKSTLKMWDEVGGLNRIKLKDISTKLVQNLPSSIKEQGLSSSITTGVLLPKTKLISRFPLTIETYPNKALVRIMNITPRYHGGIALPAREYDIFVEHPNYRSQRFWLDISEPTRLSVTLQKYGSITCSPSEKKSNTTNTKAVIEKLLYSKPFHDNTYTYTQNLGTISFSGAYFRLAELLDERQKNNASCLYLERKKDWVLTNNFAQMKYFVPENGTYRYQSSKGRICSKSDWRKVSKKDQYIRHTYALERNTDDTMTLISQVSELNNAMFKTGAYFKSQFCNILESI